MALAAGCAASPAGKWASSHYKNHPLTGAIVEVSSGDKISPEALADAVTAADYALLGESHDNRDHHNLQAWLLRHRYNARPDTALVLEMLEPGDAAAVQAYLAAGPKDASGFGLAVGWDEKGWPNYRNYAPVLEPAIAARGPIVAGNLSRSLLRRLKLHATGAAGPEVLVDAGIEAPLSPEMRFAMEHEITEAHCGHAPGHYLATMVNIQRARDTAMARALAEHGGAALIAGSGHTRRDYGVSLRLAEIAPEKTVVSIGFVEVSPDLRQAAEYAARFGTQRLPFDYVWFTPRNDATDPCSRYKEQLKRKLRKKKAPSPDHPIEPYLPTQVSARQRAAGTNTAATSSSYTLR